MAERGLVPLNQVPPDQIPRKVDISSATQTKDPEIIASTLRALEARESYLSRFIQEGYSQRANPMYGTGLPAEEELNIVRENIRTLAFRAAYVSRGSSILPPFARFNNVNKNFRPDGGLGDGLMNALESLDERQRPAFRTILQEAGQGLAFQGNILALEGSKGATRDQPPSPEQAFGAVRSKVMAVRARLKVDAKAKMTVRRTVVEAARQDPRWDRGFERGYTLLKDHITEYDVTSPAATKLELLRTFTREKEMMDSQPDDQVDWDRYYEVSLEIERLSK